MALYLDVKAIPDFEICLFRLKEALGLVVV